MSFYLVPSAWHSWVLSNSFDIEPAWQLETHCQLWARYAHTHTHTHHWLYRANACTAICHMLRLSSNLLVQSCGTATVRNKQHWEMECGTIIFFILINLFSELLEGKIVTENKIWSTDPAVICSHNKFLHNKRRGERTVLQSCICFGIESCKIRLWTLSGLQQVE